MNRKLLALLGVVVLLVAMFPVSASADGPVEPPDTFPRNAMAPAGLDPMDLSVEMLGEDERQLQSDTTGGTCNQY